MPLGKKATKTKKAKKPTLSREEKSGINALISLKIMESSYSGQQKKKNQLWAIMAHRFHGKQGTRDISYVHLMSEGLDPFENLFEVDEDLGGKKVMKPKYLRSGNQLILGQHITRDVLEVKNKKSKELISGRTLWDSAVLALREIKKALPFLKEHLDENGHPKKSGDTQEQIIERLLDHMWMERNNVSEEDDEEESSMKPAEEDIKPSPPKKQKVVDTPSSEDTSSDEEEDDDDDDVVEVAADRPTTWVFKGFPALMYYGPFAENIEAGRTIDFLIICKDPPKSAKKGYSRGAQRDEVSKHEAFERTREENRGVSKEEEHMFESRKIKMQEIEQSKYETELFMLNFRAERLTKLLDTESKRATALDEWDKYDKCRDELNDVEAEIKAVTARMNGTTATAGMKGTESHTI